ncbi:MAG: 2-phospho-L-lactate transferase [Actinomycetota bacterium]
MKVTALAGGVGGGKLLVGLQRATDGLTAIVNTADDAVIYDVHVSPDVDIVTYWLAGLADTDRGWGIRGDTFEAVDALGRLGTYPWFRLGDRDLATCMFRTGRLRAGDTLTAVTDTIRRALDVPTTILPMSDDPVSTRVVTADRRVLEFQQYFVAERHEPEVVEVRFAGIADAKPAPGVVEALETADKVIICPSNPVVSIGPILALPEVRDVLRAHPSVIAVSPIVRGTPLKGPADKLLRAVGAEVSASGVAALYADFVDLFVVDESDAEEIDRVEAIGIRAAGIDTIMVDHDASERLARALL